MVYVENEAYLIVSDNYARKDFYGCAWAFFDLTIFDLVIYRNDAIVCRMPSLKTVRAALPRPIWNYEHNLPSLTSLHDDVTQWRTVSKLRMESTLAAFFLLSASFMLRRNLTRHSLMPNVQTKTRAWRHRWRVSHSQFCAFVLNRWWFNFCSSFF